MIAISLVISGSWDVFADLGRVCIILFPRLDCLYNTFWFYQGQSLESVSATVVQYDKST